MPRLRKMSAAGDHVVAEWSFQTKDGYEKARREFEEELKKGCTAFRVSPGGESAPVTTLDEEVDADVLLVPPIVGG